MAEIINEVQQKTKILSPDAIKCIYRGNFTKKQAALYFGVSVDEVQKRIDQGELGINLDRGEEKVSREECDRYLRDRKRYIKTPKV